MSEKIRPTHLERAAYVYVRQSTVTQVRENRESQRRQYHLADRARELGFRQVVVVDEDLAPSMGSKSKASRTRPAISAARISTRLPGPLRRGASSCKGWAASRPFVPRSTGQTLSSLGDIHW